MSKQFLHNSAGAIDIPVSHEKIIKRNLWKKRNQNFLPTKNREKLTGKQPTVSFNLNHLTRIGQNLPRKGALQTDYIANISIFVDRIYGVANCCCCCYCCKSHLCCFNLVDIN